MQDRCIIASESTVNVSLIIIIVICESDKALLRSPEQDEHTYKTHPKCLLEENKIYCIQFAPSLCEHSTS